MFPDDIEYYLPRSGRLVKEDGTYVNEAEVALQQESAYTVFNEIRSVQRTSLISLTSIFPLSILRDFISRGTVTHDVDRYLVKPNSTFESAKIGRYVPGYPAEVGIGVLFDQTVITDANWGYFDSQDGVFFRWDGTDYSLGIRRAGVDTIIPRADWNNDKLDGTGPSGIDLDMRDGYVFRIEYTWYGYGPILYSIMNKRNGGPRQTRLYPIHIASVEQDTTLRNPNLPITAENNSAVGDVAVTGRQFSIIGEFAPEQRQTTYTNPALVTVSNSWTPVQSYRRIASLTNISIAADAISVINESTNLVEYQLLVNTTLTGAVFGPPENRSVGETAVQFDTSATGYTGGEHIAGDVVLGQDRGSAVASAKERPVEIRIPRDYTVTLVARTLATGATADVRGVVKVTEEF